MVQLSHPYVTTGKTIALTIWTFVSKVMSLLFTTLSRLVKAFLPRSKHLLISWLKSPSAEILEPPKIKPLSFHCFPICDFGAQENKICHSFHFFPFYLPWRDGTRCHDLSFFFECWVISQLFHPRQMSHPGRLACPDHTAASSLITWDQQPCTRGQLGPPLPSTTLACKITSINSLTTQGLDTIVTSTSFWGALMQIDWFTSSRSHSWKRAECNRK